MAAAHSRRGDQHHLLRRQQGHQIPALAGLLPSAQRVRQVRHGPHRQRHRQLHRPQDLLVPLPRPSPEKVRRIRPGGHPRPAAGVRFATHRCRVPRRGGSIWRSPWPTPSCSPSISTSSNGWCSSIGGNGSESNAESGSQFEGGAPSLRREAPGARATCPRIESRDPIEGGAPSLRGAFS